MKTARPKGGVGFADQLSFARWWDPGRPKPYSFGRVMNASIRTVNPIRRSLTDLGVPRLSAAYEPNRRHRWQAR